jgi:mono/diheme cytochrome c family protein
MPPVPGTVSREVTPYPIAAGDFVGAAKLVDPLTPTPAVLREGQYRFNIYCSVCHGRDGDAANGYVAKYFSGVIPLNTIHVSQMSDGEIFHIITMGRGRMPNYAAQVPPQSRWAVVQYLRCLNRAALAALDIDKQLAADQKAAKEKPEDGNLRASVAADMAASIARKRDLAAIESVSDRDARAFEPLADPRPEYEEPIYPAATSEQEQGK